MADKDLIELTTENKTYTGRFLGFMKDDEFNALVQNGDKVASRIETKATQDIMDTAIKFNDVSGHRLVMAVKEIDRATTNKKLFVSARLNVCRLVDPANGKVTLTTEDQEDVEILEKK